MRNRVLVLAVLLCLSGALYAQAAPDAREVRIVKAPERWQIYGGYSFQSNSFNGVPGHTQSLNGGEVALAFPYIWPGIRFKAETMIYRGHNYNADQNATYIVGGLQYDHKFGRETLFGEVLAGDIALNRYWGPNGHAGMTTSFTTVVGGGLDTPIAKHFAARVSGDWVYENYSLIQAVTYTQPYRVPGLPNYFGKAAAGVVWKF